MLLAGVIGGLIATTVRRNAGQSDKELAEMRERVQRLEQSLETMSADMERVSEGQRFLTALLEDRAKGQPALKPPPVSGA
jgi:hypothetical protein